MPWTDYQKVLFGNLVTESTIYIAGHTSAPGPLGQNELQGHGYSRGPVAPGQLTVSAAGLISTTEVVMLYTPTDDNAQDTRFLSVWNAMAGGDMQAYALNEIPDIEIPIQGRAVNISAGTIINT